VRPLRQVRKRDGRLVPFDRGKIADAIFRAAQSVGGEDRFLAEQLAGVVAARLESLVSGGRGSAGGGGQSGIPTIEQVQDLVERVLIDAGHARTAKAYILYRERRADARAAHSLRREAGPSRASAPMGAEPTGEEARGGDGSAREESSGPLVGGDRALPSAGAGVRRWSKAEVAERLVRREALDRREAEILARAVEDRLLRARVPRVTEEMLDTLVRAELFDRGWTARAARPRADSVAAADVEAVLTVGTGDRRSVNPAVLAEGLGEALIAQHVLDRHLPPAVAEAHRLGDLHVYDLGAPLRLATVALATPVVAPRSMVGERFSRAGGVRRAFAVLADLVLRYAPHAARVLALEDVNVWLAPFVAHLGEDALAEEVREFLLSPALTAVHRRGGLLRIELGLAAGVPARLAHLDTPAPAPPGRTFGDYEDAALHVTRAFLREAAELRRAGHWVDCALTLVLPRGAARDASRRALIRQALAAAGEGGEPVMIFDDPEAPTRGSRWLRLREQEYPDPLRFERGDVSASGAVAINLVSAALRTRAAGIDDFVREADRLVRLALEAGAAQRGLLDQLGAAPGGALYALRCGMHPLVDLEAAFYLVEIVGVDQAAALLLPESESVERLGMRERLVRHIHGRVREEALGRRMCASVAEGLSPEAALRFAASDAERYPHAAAWWPRGNEPTYARPCSEGVGLSREPLHPDRLRGGPSVLRVRHRVGADHHPPMEDLLDAMEAAEQDTAVLEYAVDPWPRRIIHGDP